MELRHILRMLFRCTCYAVAGFVSLLLGMGGIMYVERNSHLIPGLGFHLVWVAPLLLVGTLTVFAIRHCVKESSGADASTAATDEKDICYLNERDLTPAKWASMPYNEALRRVSQGEVVRPLGWFRWLNRSKCAWYPPQIELGLSQEWRVIAHQLSDNPALLDAPLLSEVRRHGWLVGKLGLRHLVHAAWPHFSAAERGHALAGLSEDYDSWSKTKEDRASDSHWIVTFLPDASLSATEVLELACNAVYQEDVKLLAAVLSKGRHHLDAIVERDDRHGWAEDLKEVSDRVIDMVLEASIFRCWAPGASLALDYGADPNLHLWDLEDCQNEHFTSVGWLIASGRSRRDRAPGILNKLIHHPKFKAGPTHSKALVQAMSGWWDDEWAWRLIEKGVTFQSLIKPNWLAAVPQGQEYDWRNCHWRMVRERRGSLDRTYELVQILPMISCHEASWFDSQYWLGGPTWVTPISRLLHDGHLLRLQKYAAAGLPLRLTFFDYLNLIHAKAAKTLEWLMEQWQTPPDTRIKAMNILIDGRG